MGAGWRGIRGGLEKKRKVFFPDIDSIYGGFIMMHGSHKIIETFICHGSINCAKGPDTEEESVFSHLAFSIFHSPACFLGQTLCCVINNSVL